VAYELGFDQALFDEYLLRISGFYRDIQSQQSDVEYFGLGGIANYITQEPWEYEDIRGVEVTLTKNRGRWIRGFVNYTFQQTKDGQFGFPQFHENSLDQRNFLAGDASFRLNVPLAQPFARMNLLVLTPTDLKSPFLRDWRFSLLGEWRSGDKFAWGSSSQASFPELRNNVQWKNYWMFDFRISKHIGTSQGVAQIFLDISNVFNIRHVYRSSSFTPDDNDENLYFQSLHLPCDTYDGINSVDASLPCEEKNFGELARLFIPGDDKPGDYRGDDVAFQPMEAVTSLDNVSEPNEGAWYWARDTGTYSEWNGSSWTAVASGDVSAAIDKKDYIDMPNFRETTFMNPRRLIIGVRLTF